MSKTYVTSLVVWYYGANDNELHVLDKTLGEFTDIDAAHRQIEFFMSEGNFPLIIDGTVESGGFIIEEISPENFPNECKILEKIEI